MYVVAVCVAIMYAHIIHAVCIFKIYQDLTKMSLGVITSIKMVQNLFIHDPFNITEGS